MLIQALVGGLVFGLYFTLIGLGLNLVFGVMRVVNIAQGSFVMLGAYAAVFAWGLFRLHPAWAAVAVLGAFFVVGLPIYYLVIPRLQVAKDAEMLSLILFFGLAQMIEAGASILFGATERSVPSLALGFRSVVVLGERLPSSWVVSAAVSAICVAGVYLYLYQTTLGTLTRAVMVSRSEAVASGIDVDRVCAVAFGIGIGLAGVAGVFAPFMFGSVTPAMGEGVNIAAFAVIVVGTLGNPLGTVLGGIIYGVSLLLMQTYLSSWANLLPNLLLIAVLLARPNGLLGRATRSA